MESYQSFEKIDYRFNSKVRVSIIFLELIFLVINTISAIRYNYGPWDMIIVLINMLLFYIYFHNQLFKNNFLYLMLYGYVFLSSTVVAAFQLQQKAFFYYGLAEYSDFHALALFSNRLLFVLSIPLIFKPLFREKTEIKLFLKDKIKRGNGTLVFITNVLFFIAFSFTIISFFLGINDVSEASITLPFHLNGFIDEYRRTIFPILFSVYIYDCLANKRNIKKGILFLYFLWSILEMLVRVSKGAILTSFLPIFITYFIAGKFTVKVFLSKILPITIIFLVFYPVIENLRSFGNISFANLYDSFTSVFENESSNSSPFLRLFINGIDYIKVRKIVDSDVSFFCFDRASVLVSERGSAFYITHVIEGFDRSYHHSSGTTGIVDALLFGGYGLAYFFVFIMGFISLFINNRLFKNKKIYLLIVAMLMKTLIMQRSISFFIDPLVIASVVSLLIEIVFIHFYYKYLGGNLR